MANTQTKTKFSSTIGRKFSQNENKYEVINSINEANINVIGNIEFGGNKNGSNFYKDVSLKNKIISLEDSIQETSKKMNQIKKETGSLKVETQTLSEMVKIKKMEVRRVIAQEISRVDEEMKRYFAHQKAENSRLSQQLNQFRNDKVTYNNLLNEINKKIRDLELQIGLN